MVTIEQGYYIAYKFLEQYWLKVDKFRQYIPNDSFSFVTVVSGMHTKGIGESRSSDPAKYEYWSEVIEDLRLSENSMLTEKEVFLATVRYIEFHQREFDMNVTEALADMESERTQEIWRQVVEEALVLISGS